MLHPFDLAINKVLALVGRLEVRDWVDVIESSRRLQHLGYLAWAAPAKEPGFSPAAILEHAGRSAHYSVSEVSALAFHGEPPDAAALARAWRELLAEARALHQILPADYVGMCLLDAERKLFNGDVDALRRALDQGGITFHAGSIRGTLPTPVDPAP